MNLVILERDGVINQCDGEMINSSSLWQPIDGSLEAIAKLSRLGFTIVIATNQPGLASGNLDLDELEAIHFKLTDMVETRGGNVEAIFYCPHSPDDDCSCHKPKTGLIDAIEVEFDICAAGRPYVADKLSDIQTAIAKQCQPILVSSGLGQQTLEQLVQDPIEGMDNIPVFENLAAAADYIADHFG